MILFQNLEEIVNVLLDVVGLLEDYAVVAVVHVVVGVVLHTCLDVVDSSSELHHQVVVVHDLVEGGHLVSVDCVEQAAELPTLHYAAVGHYLDLAPDSVALNVLHPVLQVTSHQL